MMDTSRFFSNFILRTPKLSFDFLPDILRDQKEFIRWCNNSDFQEAIFLASPVLYLELKKYLNNEIEKEKEKEKVIYSLVKYLSRMSTRCTPFALFSGCSIGNIDTDSRIILNEEIRRFSRLDMYYLCSLAQGLIKIPEIKNKLKYYPNSSIYKIGSKYRYIEYYIDNGKRCNRLVSVDCSIYLEQILSISLTGARIDDINQLLIKNHGIEENEALRFIDDLLLSQVLISEIDPVITGKDYFTKIIDVLQFYNIDIPEVVLLKKIQKYLLDLDYGSGDSIIVYNSILECIKSLNISFQENYIFQVDMHKNMLEAKLDVKVLNEVYSAIQFLDFIFLYNRNESLNQFQQAFTTRYEEEEIPLAQVLDPDIGIGYPVGRNYDNSDLLRDFIVPEKAKSHSSYNNKLTSVIINKIFEAKKNNETFISLYEDDFEERIDVKNEFKLPPTFYAIFKIISDQNNNRLIALDYVGGSSGVNLLSRFALSDEAIGKIVNQVASYDRDTIDNVEIVEIVHLPESRIGNILTRPHIRNYEFVYLASSDLNLKNQINISDLTVSVKGGKMSIRSKKLNKEIIPRLSTAHNYSYNSMPVYHFLCDMQFYNVKPGVALDLSSLSTILNHIPRIQYKNVILYPACWFIEVSDLNDTFNIIDPKLMLESLNIWRKRLQMPKCVLLVESDNKLFVDFESEISAKTFYFTIKNRKMIKMEEFLFGIDSGFVKDINGNRYVNEFIVIFKN